MPVAPTTPTDWQTLLNQGGCNRCIATGMQLPVIIWLLDQWLKKKEPSFPCGTPTNTIVLSGSGIPDVNTTFNKFDAVTWVDGSGFYNIEFSGGIWTIKDTTFFFSLYSTPDGTFPCTWQVVNGTPPAPTGQYV